ncbi:hypothetical protein DBR43_27405 [Pedobacter sp. KBW06]|uniref:DUF3667 domain-containing protein n=1 Tax=Pedobacter sp. KBW06 TaxID=2153359 RepID=UPI000F5B5CA3|nr:DUF3667 domain-containing protein [Pedobacter sp. KBW06]RQO65975.1 hypothetical protein DBR43_27405 [Pedobacter sp. KBW06]
MNGLDPTEKNQTLKRINSSYIIHEIQHLLHLESGFLFTVKQLLLKPGKLVRSFIFEDRSKITKPVIFLIFSAALLTLTFHFFHVKYEFFSLNQKIGNIDSFLEKKAISEWVNAHIGYTSLAIGFLIALWTRIFFKKHKYNIFEITVLLCYSIGQALLIMSLFALLAFAFKINALVLIGTFIGYFYVFWSIGQFFGERQLINYVKSLICCVLGTISFRMVLILLAYIFYHLGIK